MVELVDTYDSGSYAKASEFESRRGHQSSKELTIKQEANINPGSPVKTIEIVAGPNGSGKTTFGKVYLVGEMGRSVYLNPDLIGSGISPLDFEKASFHAGRVLIEEVKAMIIRGESFAFESTLSGKTWIAILKEAIAQGYQVTIYFLYLKSLKMNLQRIKRRVALGGHPIPKVAVYRRHPRCFNNFWNLYRPLCSDWYVFDNSEKKPKTILNKTIFEKFDSEKQQQFIASFKDGLLRGKIRKVRADD